MELLLHKIQGVSIQGTGEAEPALLVGAGPVLWVISLPQGSEAASEGGRSLWGTLSV